MSLTPVTPLTSLIHALMNLTAPLASLVAAAIPKPSIIPALIVLAIVVVLRVKLKRHWDATRTA